MCAEIAYRSVSFYSMPDMQVPRNQTLPVGKNPVTHVSICPSRLQYFPTSSRVTRLPNIELLPLVTTLTTIGNHGPVLRHCLQFAVHYFLHNLFTQLLLVVDHIVGLTICTQRQYSRLYFVLIVAYAISVLIVRSLTIAGQIALLEDDLNKREEAFDLCRLFARSTTSQLTGWIRHLHTAKPTLDHSPYRQPPKFLGIFTKPLTGRYSTT